MSEGAYYTSFTSRLVLNIMCEWGDWLRLLSLTIFIHNSCLDLARGLLVSFQYLRLVLVSTLRFHFSTVLFTFLTPQGSIPWGMDIVAGNLWSTSCSLLVAVSWSVLGWVDTVALSSSQLPLLGKLEALIVTSSSS